MELTFTFKVDGDTLTGTDSSSIDVKASVMDQEIDMSLKRVAQ